MCQDPSTISARTQAERRRKRHRPRRLLRTCAPHGTWGRRASWWMRAGNCRFHCTWGRRASWWMRREDVPGPKHNIGQDPTPTTTQTTPTATTLNDDDDLDRRPTTTKDRDRHCRSVMPHGFLVCQPSCRLLLSPSVALSLSLSLCPLSVLLVRHSPSVS